MSLNKPTLAKIKIKFPEKLWISEIYKKFPDLRMEIQYFLPYDLEESIGNSIIEIMYYNIEKIIDEIKNHNSVFEFSIIEQEEHKIKFNVKTKDPYLLYGIIKCGVLVDFPIKVRNGFAYWKLISTRNRIDELLTLFENKDINFTLLKIGHSSYKIEDNKNKLSLEESRILEKAIELGFFEIPRNISLENLANSLGKSKSALSVMLRKIIKKKIVLKP
ncbi:MAG: helix-turn-helix domain-containing protein [Promethearchaeota archaeon]